MNFRPDREHRHKLARNLRAALPALARARAAESDRDRLDDECERLGIVKEEYRAEADRYREALERIAAGDYEYIVGEAGDFTVEDQMQAEARAALHPTEDAERDA